MPFFKRTSTHLSHRWEQLFDSFLGSDNAPSVDNAHNASSTLHSEENHTPDTLLTFMQHTLQQRSEQHTTGAPVNSKRILFVSEDNAARTQIASAYARYLGGDHIMVRSVGISPAYRVDPLVIEVLQERGIPTGDLKPKTLNPHYLGSVDAIITFNADTAFGHNTHMWDISKHTSEKALVRTMCDEVEEHVRALLMSLNITPRPHQHISPEFMAA